MLFELQQLGLILIPWPSPPHLTREDFDEAVPVFATWIPAVVKELRPNHVTPELDITGMISFILRERKPQLDSSRANGGVGR